MNRFVRLVTCGVVCVGSFAFAQDAKPEEGAPDRPRRGGDFRQSVMERLSRLANELELDRTQRADFEKALADFAEQQAGRAGSDSEFRELGEQARVAEESGDADKARQLREEMRRRRGGNADFNAFADRIRPILNENQVARLDRLREQFAARRGGMEPPLARVDNLRGELNLTPEQDATFEALRAELEKALPPRTGEGSMMELVRRAREAQQSGDQAAADEARAAAEALREKSRAALEKFSASLGAVLDADQNRKLENANLANAGGGQAGPAGIAARGGPGERGNRANDPRSAIRAARRLDLSDEQKDQLREIEEEAGRLTREAGRDRDATQRVTQQIIERVRGILSPEQLDEYNRTIAAQNGGERGRSGDQPRQRRPRAEGGGAPDGGQP